MIAHVSVFLPSPTGHLHEASFTLLFTSLIISSTSTIFVLLGFIFFTCD